MDDVTVQEQPVDSQPAETPTAATTTDSGSKTPEAPVAPKGDAPVVSEKNPEIENLNKALKEARERDRAARRELAELKNKSNQSKYDPTDYQQWQQHPYSQELLLKVAKQELTDFARDTLRDPKYDALPNVVKKAVERNVRGFVNETTTDVETAKVDLLDYLEDVLAEQMAADKATTPAPAAQAIPIVAPNAAASEKAGTPAEIAKIMAKSLDELTDEDEAVLNDYLVSQNKKSKK